MRLAIVILNYKTPHLVVDCLASLDSEMDPVQAQVVVVDNNSGDGSVATIEAAIDQNQWGSWAKVVPSPVNGGFSAGNNVGIRAIDAENYLLLNSDTIVRPGALGSLLNALEEYPDAGLISPRLEWPDETPQISCFRYRSPLGELINAAATGPVTKLLKPFDVPIPVSDKPIEPEWTSFACVLIRKAVIEEVGLMDEGYFMYFDDIDYCRQARQLGWQILHWPEARVVHLRGGSSPVKSAIQERKRPRRYLYESRSRYFAKYYGGSFGVAVANLSWYVGRSISLIRELAGRPPHTCQQEAQDIWIRWLDPMSPPQLPQSNNPSANQTENPSYPQIVPQSVSSSGNPPVDPQES